ncbi:Uncharacterised protein [Mycobacteroides abscessus subsp. abscessus]|nr:Uncharacterised protein [Mycobacteroides abscessus subsp. abscessus]
MPAPSGSSATRQALPRISTNFRAAVSIRSTASAASPSHTEVVRPPRSSRHPF